MLTTERKPVRVLLLDDKQIIRAGLRKLIESWPQFKVIGEAGNPDDAVAITPLEKPDIILFDLHFSHALKDLDLLPRLLSAYGGGKVIVLTEMEDSDAHFRAVSLGVMGLVLKEQAVEELQKAILNVHAGELWLDRKLTANIITRMLQPKKAESSNGERIKNGSLTERERRIVTLVGEGLRNKDIAKTLFISESTVRHHLTSIFKKLEVTSRLELIILLSRQPHVRTGT